jgi:hypothetical protein
VLVSTVADNRSNYSRIDYERAVMARKLQWVMGRPSTKNFVHMVEKKLLANCPVTRKDIVAAEHTFARV